MQIEFADDVPKKTPPPPTLAKPSQHATDNSAHPHRLNGQYRNGGREFEKPLTPTPDYDSLIYNNSNSNNIQLDDQPRLNISAIPPPPPPLQKLSLTKGPAPPKPTRQISVTIGEYDSRKEPSKLGFLNKANKDNSPGGGASTSEMLQNELQLTLSRSNLKKTSDVAKNTAHQTNGGGPPKVVTKTVLEKTGSANIERLTSMLNSRNTNAGVNSINSNGTNKVTISIPKSKGLSTEAAEVKSSPNGILKTANGGSNTQQPAAAAMVHNSSSTAVGVVANGAGGSTANGEVKNIKFDNM